MNETKQIAINILATYARSIIILFVNLFSSRWLLMALGETDYGLYGLVGGLTIFISFFAQLLSNAVSRFYAYADGEKQARIEGAENRVTEWFNTALLVHFILPTILLPIGYPLCTYAICNWLTIPDNRIVQCLWVFRLSCLGCYVGMINVPLAAMFLAKQKIAEYTFYMLIMPLISIVFIYYMTLHEREWLVLYAFVVACLSVGTQFLICIRAFRIFPECKIRKSLFWDKAKLKSLVSFAGWQCLGSLGVLIRGQGMAVLGNIQYGPNINASITIATRVSAQTDTLSAGLRTAFTPAITTSYGAKDYEKMKWLTTATNRIGSMLILLLALPLLLEIGKLFELWLKDPPEYSEKLCLFIIAALIIDKTTNGYTLAVNASGKVALYQGVLGTLLILALPLAYLFIKFGMGVISIGYAIFITSTLCSLGRIFFAKRILAIPINQWIKKVLLPIGFVCILSITIGYLPHLFMQESIKRLIVTFGISEAMLVSLSWFIVLDIKEKLYIKEKITLFIKKIKRV